ncbi:MAG: 23S rRNA (guanosine(2251)-2'-O)-methyltransferase RlmB [Rhodospirillaceae bacterium]|nr:23S rRNA (guanosine(2251)-2'-O)-methyltransferase RlmB [Rhodospirillaceae bacterium]|tara:strand:+ start:612 stop:1379 length:768 start_codon:yes stop_codon:yes gene_type:complete
MAGGRSRRQKRPRTPGNSQDLWIYGLHAVSAALSNSDRTPQRLLVLNDKVNDFNEINSTLDIKPETVSRDQLEAILPPGAVHQGVAALVDPLPNTTIDDLCAKADSRSDALVIILDRVSDPQNIGAIIRSAAVFGAMGVIVQDRHAPQVTGVVAKAASGGLEDVPVIRVTNLSRAMETLKSANFWCVGLDSEAAEKIQSVERQNRTALVLGAEGAGLRRLVRENCDELVKIEGSGAITSLNVSNAAAVALFALSR